MGREKGRGRKGGREGAEGEKGGRAGVEVASWLLGDERPCTDYLSCIIPSNILCR